jgi:hypothetical protein
VFNVAAADAEAVIVLFVVAPTVAPAGPVKLVMSNKVASAVTVGTAQTINRFADEKRVFDR